MNISLLLVLNLCHLAALSLKLVSLSFCCLLWFQQARKMRYIGERAESFHFSENWVTCQGPGDAMVFKKYHCSLRNPHFSPFNLSSWYFSDVVCFQSLCHRAALSWKVATTPLWGACHPSIQHFSRHVLTFKTVPEKFWKWQILNSR